MDVDETILTSGGSAPPIQHQQGAPRVADASAYRSNPGEIRDAEAKIDFTAGDVTMLQAPVKEELKREPKREPKRELKDEPMPSYPFVGREPKREPKRELKDESMPSAPFIGKIKPQYMSPPRIGKRQKRVHSPASPLQTASQVFPDLFAKPERKTRFWVPIKGEPKKEPKEEPKREPGWSKFVSEHGSSTTESEDADLWMSMRGGRGPGVQREWEEVAKPKKPRLLGTGTQPALVAPHPRRTRPARSASPPARSASPSMVEISDGPLRLSDRPLRSARSASGLAGRRRREMRGLARGAAGAPVVTVSQQVPVAPAAAPAAPIIIREGGGGTQMIPYPMGGGGGSLVHVFGDNRRGYRDDYDDRRRPVEGGIRVTQKQVINEKTRRRRAAQKGTKTRTKKKSSEYVALKKKVQARIRAERAKHYKKISVEINKLPKAKRKTARLQARKTLMKTQKEIFSKMTGTKKMAIKDLRKLVTAAIRF
jgi:hypothetical protein